MKKLKPQYKKVSVDIYGLRTWYWYPNLRSHFHKYLVPIKRKAFMLFIVLSTKIIR